MYYLMNMWMNYNISNNQKDPCVSRNGVVNYRKINQKFDNENDNDNENQKSIDSNEWILVPSNNKRNNYKTRKNY